MTKLIMIASLLFAACGSASKTEEFCERADSCNILGGSVEECVEELDNALDDLTSSQREEVMFEVQKCLDRPSCDGFASCTRNL